MEKSYHSATFTRRALYYQIHWPIQAIVSDHVCIVKHNVGRGFCQHFGPIGLIATKFYSDSFSTKKHSLDYYHCIIWLYYCLPLLYINAPCVTSRALNFVHSSPKIECF